MFYGPPGLGKTTLATIIAHEMGVHIKVTSGPAIEKPGEMAAILNNLAENDILFIDEIGELQPIEMNKLLKVLEDRKVFLDSSYYSSEDPNMPTYIKEIFDNGLPADFRLIGATTRNPDEIIPAIRSRCVEVFFRG